LYKAKDGLKQSGVSGKSVSVLKDLSMHGSNVVEAMTVLRKSGLKTYVPRMRYRISPKPDGGIHIHAGKDRVIPGDISTGGALFSPRNHPMQSRTITNL